MIYEEVSPKLTIMDMEFLYQKIIERRPLFFTKYLSLFPVLTNADLSYFDYFHLFGPMDNKKWRHVLALSDVVVKSPIPILVKDARKSGGFFATIEKNGAVYTRLSESAVNEKPNIVYIGGGRQVRNFCIGFNPLYINKIAINRQFEFIIVRKDNVI